MFTIPSLLDRVQQMRAAFRAYLPGTDAWLPVNNLNSTAKVIGMGLHDLDGRIDYIQRQAFASTADWDGLIKHGNEYGLSPKPAAPASGNVLVAATSAVTIAAGSLLARSDGVTFTVPAATGLITGGTASIAVTATASGSEGVTLGGTALTVVSGITGAATFTVDSDGLAGGADVEEPESFRSRILFRKRYPPHGGAPSDYVGWVLDNVPGATRVFVERRWNGPGTVRVFPLFDAAPTGPIPNATQVAQVAGVLDSLAPAGAFVTVAAATPLPISVTTSGLSPFSVDVQEAVLAELRDCITRLGSVAGGDTPNTGMPFLAVPQTFSASWIWQAVTNAAGEARVAITAPAADIVQAAGTLPVLGTMVLG